MDKSVGTRRMKPLLGTFVEVGTKDRDIDFGEFNPVLDVIQEIHNLLSFHDPKSDLSKLNSSNGEFIELDRLSIRALRLAKAMGLKTNDQFNPTVGGKLVELGVLPKHQSFSDKTIRVGCSLDLEIKGSTARLLRPVLVTLDGIAKGLAVDLGIQTMKARGFKSGWINAGGDLRVFGNCKLPIQRRMADGSFESLGVVQDAALASSQLQQKHSTDFKSWIVSAGPKSRKNQVCTVMAKKAWRADALTKVAIAGGNNVELVEQLGGRVIPQP